MPSSGAPANLNAGLGKNRFLNFSRLLDNIPMGVLIMDLQRRVIFCNQALSTLIGLPSGAAVGLHCRNVMRSRACLTDCPAARSGGLAGPVCFESDLINRDRKNIPLRVTLSPIYDVDHRPTGFVEAVEDLRLLKEVDRKISRAFSFGHIVGQSAQMQKLFSIMPVIAQSDSSVLISGETGTGKDVLAEALHQESGRVKGPFVKINCGALPESLLESELFGHTKGAFTGAVENKKGRFHLAHNGTLYLTEIGDLPLPLQVKLLTFLDDKVVYPLGSTKGFAADVRIIAATHRNLEQMVREGRFRQDLFFRLNVLRLHIPPLREREGDIRLLLDYFLSFFTQKMHREIDGYAAKAVNVLLSYSYPGNVRELRNIVEYAANVCRENKIHPKHLPSYISESRAAPLVEQSAYTLAPAPVPVSVNERAAAHGSWPLAEKQIIMEALIKAKGNRMRAAAQLGWARSTLWRKMKHYGIDTE